MYQDEYTEVFDDGFQQGYDKGYDEAENDCERQLQRLENEYEFELQVKNFTIIELFNHLIDKTGFDIDWNKLSNIPSEDYSMLKEHYKKRKVLENENH